MGSNVRVKVSNIRGLQKNLRLCFHLFGVNHFIWVDWLALRKSSAKWMCMSKSCAAWRLSTITVVMQHGCSNAFVASGFIVSMMFNFPIVFLFWRDNLPDVLKSERLVLPYSWSLFVVQFPGFPVTNKRNLGLKNYWVVVFFNVQFLKKVVMSFTQTCENATL